MAWLLVSSVSAAPGLSGGTSSAIDTTGADLLVLFVSRYSGGSGLIVSDSYGNTWTPLTYYTTGPAASARFFYAPAPVVGPGHTFTVTGANLYPAFAALAYSGAVVSSPFDAENGSGTVSGTSLQPGSVMPSVAGSLIVTGLGWDGAAGTGTGVDSGFTVAHLVLGGADVNEGGAVAYLSQGAAAAVNPTWSWTTAENAAAAIAVFKPAAVSPPPPPAGGLLLLRRRLAA